MSRENGSKWFPLYLGACLKGVEVPDFGVFFRLCSENRAGDVHSSYRRKKMAHRANNWFSCFRWSMEQKSWHITHLKEQAFRVTITKTFWRCCHETHHWKNQIRSPNQPSSLLQWQCRADSGHALLAHCEDVGIETPESKTANSNFNAALETLPIDLINRIYTLAVTMNAEETRAAFHAGVKLGAQLMMEVQRKNSWRNFE